jgi:macrolide transport system ATP-binding/permease protein
MNALLRFLRKLSIFFRREKFTNDLNEEMEFHREQTANALRQDGLTPASSQHAAHRQFGNVGQIQDQSRDAISFGFETTLHDFRYAIRQLRKNPGFALTAILILALGIGASVSIFGFVDAALLKPLPYSNPNGLVAVYERVAMIPRSNLSYLDYVDWKKRNTSFASFDIWSGMGFLLSTSEGIHPAPGSRVSSGFFRTLGVAPVLGRDFRADEDLPGATETVMLSYGAWQQWFGGKQDILGRAITLSGISYTVIGVLPRDFRFALRGPTEFWTSLRGIGECEQRRSCHNLYGVARLKDGVTVQTAFAEMNSIAKQLEMEYPVSNRGQSAAIVPLSEAIIGDIRPILLVLLSGACLLLLIACVNVTSLLLARSESRKREIAVRGALGASFLRLVRQFATEGLVLVVAAGGLGLLFATWAMQFLTRLIPTEMTAGMPFLQSVGLNFRLVLFAVAVSVFAALLFAITPVMRMSLADIRGSLAEGGRGSAANVWRRFGSNLVVVELAIAVVLLVGAGLLGKSFYRLLSVDMAFNPDHLATLEIAAPPTAYEKDPDRIALARRILARLESLPGVTSAGTTSRLPATQNGNTDWIRFVGKPYNGEHNEVNERDVSSAFFATLQAKLIRGRFFTDSEDASKPRVAIINQTLAREYFPDEDPIGKKYGDDTLSPNSIKEIVGVVDDIREGSLDSKVWPAEYLPFNQGPDTYFDIVVRTSQDERAALPSFSAAVREIDPNIGIVDVSAMNDSINESQTAYLHRSSAWLVGGFAALALLLGVIGLYGVISYSVSQRSREIGVRMALGAPRSSVYQLILKEAGWLTLLGVGAGLICAVTSAMLMRKLLFSVESWDVPTLAGVAVMLAACALCAAYIPARRAASLDPAEVLRAE